MIEGDLVMKVRMFTVAKKESERLNGVLDALLLQRQSAWDRLISIKQDIVKCAAAGSGVKVVKLDRSTFAVVTSDSVSVFTATE